jgi:hypothetical protein
MMIIEKSLMIESDGVTGLGDDRQNLKADVTQNRQAHSVLLVKVAELLLNKTGWSKKLYRMLFKQKILMLNKTDSVYGALSCKRKKPLSRKSDRT